MKFCSLVSHSTIVICVLACNCMLQIPSNGQETSRETNNWSGFRGEAAKGIADSHPTPAVWDATDPQDPAIQWQTEVPGLGHSSPTIVGNKIFLATAIAADGEAPLKVGRGGAPTAADDDGEQSWVVLCYDKTTGDPLWRRTARTGTPRATRHAKATHANTTIAATQDRLVAFFGSEGLFCYNHNGDLLWQRDLGVINISKYGIGWGYASSPAVYGDRIALVCDDPENPFVVVLRLSDGEELWRRSRKGDCERSWGTALIHATADSSQVVVNGWPWIVSYDLESGEERWRIEGGGDNPVPTPFIANDQIYITNAHGAESPIFVIRPTARGNLTESAEAANDAVVWKIDRGGCYMSTPVVVGDYLYLGNSNGVVRCFNANTGDAVYEKRLGNNASIIASLVAADGKIYCPSEDGTVYVLKAGSEFEILAENPMGEPCFATPAISEGVIYLRTSKTLFAIH